MVGVVGGGQSELVVASRDRVSRDGRNLVRNSHIVAFRLCSFCACVRRHDGGPAVRGPLPPLNDTPIRQMMRSWRTADRANGWSYHQRDRCTATGRRTATGRCARTVSPHRRRHGRTVDGVGALQTAWAYCRRRSRTANRIGTPQRVSASQTAWSHRKQVVGPQRVGAPQTVSTHPRRRRDTTDGVGAPQRIGAPQTAQSCLRWRRRTADGSAAPQTA